LMRFMRREEALKAMDRFEGAQEHNRVSKRSLKNWVVNISDVRATRTRPSPGVEQRGRDREAAEHGQPPSARLRSSPVKHFVRGGADLFSVGGGR
jgi:hypothetical protein